MLDLSGQFTRIFKFLYGFLHVLRKTQIKTPPIQFWVFFWCFLKAVRPLPKSRRKKKKKRDVSTTRMKSKKWNGERERHKTSQNSSRDHFFFMLLQPFLSLLFSLSSFSLGSGMNSLWMMTRMSLMWIYRTKKQTRRSNEYLKIE